MLGLGLSLTDVAVRQSEAVPPPLVDIMWDLDDGRWLLLGGITNQAELSFDAPAGGNGLRTNSLISVGTTYRLVIDGLSNAEIWYGSSSGTAQKFTANGTFDATVATGNGQMRVLALAGGTVSFTQLELYEL